MKVRTLGAGIGRWASIVVEIFSSSAFQVKSVKVKKKIRGVRAIFIVVDTLHKLRFK